MNERHIMIVELVSRKGRMEVNELARLLETSTVTIRKDLDYLEDKGILKRERGYALLKSKDDINYRMAFQYKEKQRIAAAAAGLVEDGETIIVESGSTCALFVEYLAMNKHGITVVTNSAYIAGYVKEGDIQIVLLGGNYQRHVQAMVGPMTKECAAKFHVDKMFTGTDGFSPEVGFTGADMIRTDTVRAMTRSADRTYVLSQSGKLTRASAVPFLQTQEVYGLITDNKLSSDIEEYVKERGVQVTFV